MTARSFVARIRAEMRRMSSRRRAEDALCTPSRRRLAIAAPVLWSSSVAFTGRKTTSGVVASTSSTSEAPGTTILVA